MQWTKRGFEESKDLFLASDQVSLVADRRLGRRVKSESRARKSYRNQADSRSRYIARDVFMPPSGSTTLSVDCLGVISDRQMAQIAIKQLARADKKFFGWYVLTVNDVYKNRCTLRITPMKENRYHADIVLPVDPKSEDYRDEIWRIANDLATTAFFVSYGDWTDDVNLELR